jgi:integrase
MHGTKETTMASVRRHPKADRSWQVRYRDPDGKQRSRNFGRKVDAERFAATTEADKVRGEWVDPDAGSITFAEFTERWLATRVDWAPQTRERNLGLLANHVLPVFGHRAVRSIQPSEVERWFAELERAPNTKVKTLQLFSAVLELARRDSAVRSNPTQDVKRPRQKPRRRGKALTDEQLAAVIEAADTADPRNGAMVYVMARMGLRVGEAMALRRGDVDLGPGMLHVRSSMARSGDIGPLKGRDEDEPRSLPTPPDVLARLNTHLEATAAVVHIGGFLFTGARGGRMRYTNWRNRVWGADQHPKPGTIRDRVGFDVKPHDLRHTAATNLFVRDRWTVPEVQAYMGHRDHKTTLAIYTHVTADQLPTPSSFGVI